MDIGEEPVNEEEKDILERGIGYLWDETIVSLFIVNGQEYAGQTFSFLSCYPTASEDNGAIVVGNSENPLGRKSRAYDSRQKLYKHYYFLKRKLSKNPRLEFVWEGRMNDSRLS